MTEVDSTVVRAGFLLESLGADLTDPNFKDTPARWVKHLREVFAPLTDEELEEYRRAVFPKTYDGMVSACGIEAFGTCPHHILPVVYVIHVAYIPREVVIGLSKLPRLVTRIARLPILQEDVTVRLVQELQKLVGTEHVGVVVSGKHLCMGCRGIKQPQITVTTAEMSGHFASNDQDAKGEFMKYIERSGR